MMYTNNLTDSELIRYLLTTSTDPVVHRLIRIIGDMDFIKSDLVKVGMDEDTLEFEYCKTPSEYIRDLENEIEFLNDQVAELNERITEMEPMTVMEFVAALNQRMVDEKDRSTRLEKDLRDEQKRSEKMQEKLNTWTIISTP